MQGRVNTTPTQERGNNLMYASDWQYYKNVEDEEVFASKMLVLLIIEIMVYYVLKKIGIL